MTESGQGQQPDDLGEEWPSESAPQVQVDETLQKVAISFQGVEISTESSPGTRADRASCLTIVIAGGVLAGLAAAGICNLGKMSGTVTTATGLGALLVMIIVGLVYMSQAPDSPRRPKK